MLAEDAIVLAEVAAKQKLKPNLQAPKTEKKTGSWLNVYEVVHCSHEYFRQQLINKCMVSDVVRCLKIVS